ncbi:MAG: radical SAM/SPASM domain-containing protein [Candidatus Aminicenantes bacterium]|nr:radical SAM/SPASM domain-containing protein [Candidatus Aminicenantes bacterium]
MAKPTSNELFPEGKNYLMKKDDNFSIINKNHFNANLDMREKLDLFKSSVKMIEIEVFSFCNRRCWFCPNLYIDRHSDNIFMQDSIYKKVIYDLKKIDYSNKISFSRYNEPLSNKNIFKRLIEAHEVLPSAQLHMNTNGDYLERDTIPQLYECGLSSLNIQVYIPNGMEYSDKKAYSLVSTKIKALNLEHKLICFKSMKRLEYRLIYENMSIRIYSKNFIQSGNYRAGLISKLKKSRVRTSPCLIPFRDLYIDFNGKVVPCCNIRSDIPEHKNYIIGDLSRNEDNIFSIFSSKEIIDWRKQLFGFWKKSAPCDYCSFQEVESTWTNRKKAREVSKMCFE